MKIKNRFVKWARRGVGIVVLLAVAALMLRNGESRPWALPCRYSLEDQVKHPRYGADMIFEITIRDSSYLREWPYSPLEWQKMFGGLPTKGLCKYGIALDNTLLYDFSKHDHLGSTGMEYLDSSKIPKNLTIYDNLLYPTEVRGRILPSPPCDSPGSRYLLFLHRLYIDDFIKTGVLHCRGAAYLRPITEKETVMEYISDK